MSVFNKLTGYTGHKKKGAVRGPACSIVSLRCRDDC